MELLSPDIIMNLLLSYRDVQVCGARRGRQARPTSPRPDPPEALNELSDIFKPWFPGRKPGKAGHPVGSPRTVQCLHFLEVCRGWWVGRWGVRWEGTPAQGLPQAP